MREINKIIIHCSDSDYGHHDNIEVIRYWHKKRGWKGTYDELIGGGDEGFDFIRGLLSEILEISTVNIGTVSLLLTNKKQIEEVLSILPDKIVSSTVQINAGTRKRFILRFTAKNSKACNK